MDNRAMTIHGHDTLGDEFELDLEKMTLTQSRIKASDDYFFKFELK